MKYTIIRSLITVQIFPMPNMYYLWFQRATITLCYKFTKMTFHANRAKYENCTLYWFMQRYVLKTHDLSITLWMIIPSMKLNYHHSLAITLLMGNLPLVAPLNKTTNTAVETVISSMVGVYPKHFVKIWLILFGIWIHNLHFEIRK